MKNKHQQALFLAGLVALAAANLLTPSPEPALANVFLAANGTLSVDQPTGLSVFSEKLIVPDKTEKLQDSKIMDRVLAAYGE